MTMRQVVFDYREDKLAINILQADANVNSIFQAAVLTHIRPYALAASMGRLSEARSEQLLARVYADGIIVGSPTEGYDKFTQADWEKWLLENKEEFRQLRSVAECPEAFGDNYGQSGNT